MKTQTALPDASTESIRQDERAACCAVLCDGCARHDEIYRAGPDWRHRRFADGQREDLYCLASRLREAAPSDPEADPDPLAALLTDPARLRALAHEARKALRGWQGAGPRGVLLRAIANGALGLANMVEREKGGAG